MAFSGLPFILASGLQPAPRRQTGSLGQRGPEPCALCRASRIRLGLWRGVWGGLRVLVCTLWLGPSWGAAGGGLCLSVAPPRMLCCVFLWGSSGVSPLLLTCCMHGWKHGLRRAGWGLWALTVALTLIVLTLRIWCDVHAQARLRLRLRCAPSSSAQSGSLNHNLEASTNR
jgi:hypothetical protein